MSAEQTPDIAAVLAEHEYMLQNSRGSICRCGFVPTVDADSLNTQQDYHRAHVAAALATVRAAAVREAEQRAWDEGYEAAEYMARCWGHTDSWEDEPENPYRPVSHERGPQ